MSSKVLVVCTANVCRSPMAAAILADTCARAGSAISVSSAGTTAVDLGVDPVAVGIMAERGLDISQHVPHRVTRDDLATADLVIAMTRDHVRTLVADHRSRFARTFTLKELARRIEAVGVDDGLPGLHVGRSPSDLLGSASDDDIADPFGGPRRGYDVAVADIDRSLTVFGAALRSGLLPWSR